MKTIKAFAKTFTLLSFLASCQKAPSEKGEDPALSQAAGLHSSLWFQQSEECALIYRQAYRQAERMLVENHPRYSGSDSQAVVLDLDETVLDNSPYQARLIAAGQSYRPETWNDWVREAQAELLPGAPAFLALADSLGLAIFYISNRYEETRNATLENLIALGLPQARNQRLLLRSGTSDKSERRAFVQARYQVILGLGDQRRDFSESISPALSDSMARHFVLLPNPMYGYFSALPDSLRRAPAERQNSYWLSLLDQARP